MISIKNYNQIPEEERKSGNFSDATITCIQDELTIAFWVRHKKKMMNSTVHTLCSYLVTTFGTVAIFWDERNNPQFLPAMKYIAVFLALIWAFHFIYFNTVRVIKEYPTKKRIVKFLWELPDLIAINCSMTV